MPKLDELPVELLAHVALFANKPILDDNPKIALRELLALRCASRSCKDAVSRAARQHKAVESLFFHGSSAQKIAVMGRVFGIGCRDLYFHGVRSDECVSVLRNVVTSTNGQLRNLTCSAGKNSITVPKPVLLEMCSACPLLQTLYLFDAPASITANVDDFASAVGSACPLLESVYLPCSRSPAEDYQWRFPRLKCLKFNHRSTAGPIRWDKIELTLQTCVHATEVELNEQTVSPRLVDLILAAPVAGRLKALDVSCETDISPESILRFARGLEALSDLQFPHEFDGGRAFYSSLVQARPSIAKLNIGFGNKLDDDDLRIICHGLPLERLELTYVQNLTDRAIDIILESPCAETLRSIEISYDPQFSSEDVLRLCRGCPELAELEWEISEDAQLLVQNAEVAAQWNVQHVDGPNVEAIDTLLESRGGKATGVAVLQEDGSFSWRR